MTVMGNDGYVYVDGRAKSMLGDPQENIYRSSRVWVNSHAIRTCHNIRQDGDLIIGWDVCGGTDQRCVWKLTGATHPDYPMYLEAVWPD